MTKEWRELKNDEEFASLFKGAIVLDVTTYPSGLPYIGADLFWHLSTGTWLAMKVSTDQGCSTCGYGAGEKTYYALDDYRG